MNKYIVVKELPKGMSRLTVDSKGTISYLRTIEEALENIVGSFK